MAVGERFRVVYEVAGDEAGARQRARGICLEQTVEVDDALVPEGLIRDHVVGRLEAFGPVPGMSGRTFSATISYDVETTALELTQLLNVVFGNSSIQPGLRVTGLELSPTLLARFPGPRFGIAGFRERLRVGRRPLLCTALKPMGLDATALAEAAYRFARGGVDVIKDDHGLTDQAFCPFAERVPACVEAVGRANAETGQACIYVPNVTAPADQVIERARLARREGAGGIMVAPGLAGFDTIRLLSQDAAVGLPILSHPAFLGTTVTAAGNGMSHEVVFGWLQRVAGADASIYPNWGGRFGFSRDECIGISRACTGPFEGLRPILPAPGGGMSLERVPELLEAYGDDVLFLVGGALYGRSPDLEANARYFRAIVEG